VKLKEIAVDKLLGVFDYIVPLNLNEVATIIHAPNGFGKTSLLSLINAAYTLNLDILLDTPFEIIRFLYSDNTSLAVHKDSMAGSDEGLDNTEGIEETCLTFERIAEGNRQEQVFRMRDFQINPGFLREHAPWLRKAGKRSWVDRRTGTVLSRSDILSQYGAVACDEAALPQPWLRDLIEETGVTFVDTRRLEAVAPEDEEEYYPRPGRRQRMFRSAVGSDADRMRQIIQETLDKFITLSQQLDRGFPRRLLEALNEDTSVTAQEVRTKLGELNQKYVRIVDAGLLDPEQVEIPWIQAEEMAVRVFALYVADQEKKLHVFDNLLAKIETLKTLLNERYQRKTFTVTREAGYSVTADSGESLDIDALSSGEQHELVLFHNLLFEVAEGSLVIIDEPEISLHVAWQQQFLADLKKVFDLLGVHFLIATHSPSIIADRWDLTLNLAGETEE